MLGDAFDADMAGEGSNPRQAGDVARSGGRAGAPLAPDDEWR